MVVNTMNPYVIEHLCMIRDDDNDNYSDVEDHGDADGDGDCFRRMLPLILMMSTAIAFVLWLVIYSSYLPIFCVCIFTA